MELNIKIKNCIRVPHRFSFSFPYELIEVAELRKESARLKEELEILKKPQPHSLERAKIACSIY
ncbi:hypothetical protein [Enterococcus faecium]|uniref:hypothetical protein n=1 Tax=Enterococcus faecium TaxID=1352 RepID=UPI0023B227D7|nr:hypothetical protein [Enterococcus faecium]